MDLPPPVPETPKPKIEWYQHLWMAWPLVLAAVGGAVGGVCGGAAWAINMKVFQKTKDPVLKYVFTGLISVAGVVLYFVIAIPILLLMNPKK